MVSKADSNSLFSSSFSARSLIKAFVGVGAVAAVLAYKIFNTSRQIADSTNLPYFKVIKKPVVNIHAQPEKQAEVESQGRHGDCVKVIKESDGWANIRTEDEVEGWIESDQLTNNSSYERCDNLKRVRTLFANVYGVTSETIRTRIPPLMTLPFGSKVQLDETIKRPERWVQVRLADGRGACIQRLEIDFAPRLKTMAEMIDFSKTFIGLTGFVAQCAASSIAA